LLNPYRFKHMPFLNGLRGIAILSVLTQHGLGPFSAWLVGCGSWAGMDLFFVLSGFLIASLLLQEVEDAGHVNLFKFYTRRTLRIWPGYFAFLLATILLNPYDCKNLLVPAIFTATFMSDYATAFNWGGIILSGLVQTWSISIEEKFYALSPLLFGVLRKHLGLVLLSGLIACELWKALLIVKGVPWVRLEACFDTQMDGVICGSLAGLLIAEPKSRECLKQKLSLPMIPIILTATAIIMNSTLAHPSSLKGTATNLLFWSLYLPAYKLLLAALIGCLIFHRNSIVTKMLELRALQWVGTISYGTYLWHLFAFRFVGRQLIFWSLPYLPLSLETPHNLPYVIEAMKITVAIAFGAISFYGLESPFLRLKARFEPAHQKPSPPGPSGSPELVADKILA
jgi:peptidoglycan/LPS O-acetylase OafA/YrhL